ncbi:dynactin-associated protein-like [Nannospalax galili]|uniref:dynactin-associated protein-like n=1 Tax=Nannospalax galili TaxID=1026970 RepID=UPI0004ED4766|nr:dynactin-associated protein-like [Nannospalax galili]
MVRKQQQYTLNVEQNTTEQLLRSPYCSNEGLHCGCRAHHLTCQPQQVIENSSSLWKTFLLCLLACLAATAIMALIFYFGPFGKPTSNTTIIIHTDGKSSQDLCTSAPTTSPTASPLTGLQTTSPSAPVTTPTSSTSTPTPTTMTTTATTLGHEADIEEY